MLALVAVLGNFTTSQDRCWFCIWEGYGFWWASGHSPLYTPEVPAEQRAAYWQEAQQQDDFLRKVPRVQTENRAYFLFRGPLSAASSFNFESSRQSPNLWWPGDRSWCVATEIDAYSTYLGGSRKCIDQVLAAVELETIEVADNTLIDPGVH